MQKQNKMFFKSIEFMERKFNEKSNLNNLRIFSEGLMENLIKLESNCFLIGQEILYKEKDQYSLKYCLDLFITREMSKGKLINDYSNKNTVPFINIKKEEFDSQKSKYFIKNDTNVISQHNNDNNNNNNCNIEVIKSTKFEKIYDIHDLNNLKKSDRYLLSQGSLIKENNNLNKTPANNKIINNNAENILNHKIPINKIAKNNENFLINYRDDSNFSSSNLNSNSEISNDGFSEKYVSNATNQNSKNTLNLKNIIYSVNHNNNNEGNINKSNTNSIKYVNKNNNSFDDKHSFDYENIKFKDERKINVAVNISQNNNKNKINNNPNNNNFNPNAEIILKYNKSKITTTKPKVDEIVYNEQNLENINNNKTNLNNIKIIKTNDINIYNDNNNNYLGNIRFNRSRMIVDSKESNMFCFSKTFANEKQKNNSTIKEPKAPAEKPNDDIHPSIVEGVNITQNQDKLISTVKRKLLKDNLKFIPKDSETISHVKKLDKTLENSLFNENNNSEKNLMLNDMRNNSKINLLNASKNINNFRGGIKNLICDKINFISNQNKNNLKNNKIKENLKSSVLKTPSKNQSLDNCNSISPVPQEAFESQAESSVEYFDLGLFMLKRVHQENNTEMNRRENTNKNINSKNEFKESDISNNNRENIIYENNRNYLNDKNSENRSDNKSIMKRSVIIENKKPKTKQSEILLGSKFKNKMTFKESNLNQKKLFESLLNPNLRNKEIISDPSLSRLIFCVKVAKRKYNENFLFEIFIQVMPDFFAFLPKMLLADPLSKFEKNEEIKKVNVDLEAIEKANLDFEINMKKNLAKIIHEFKTPINTIISLISDLTSQRNLNSNKSLKILNLINNMSNYVVFLTKDIIQFCNIGAVDKNTKNPSSANNHENFDFQKSEVKLKKIIIFCFEILKTLLQCKDSKANINAILTFDKAIEEYYIITDELRLKQIILNLISNAIKFTKSGSIEIKCKLMQKKQVKISVKDTGIGIRDEEKTQLFNDFVMLKDKERLNEYGSGLGLSICKFLANKLNHQINFESKYNEGSCFYLILNCKKKFHKNHSQVKLEHLKLKMENAEEDALSVKKLFKANTDVLRQFLLLSRKDFYEEENSEEYFCNNNNNDGLSRNNESKLTLINTNCFEFRYNLGKDLSNSKRDYNNFRENNNISNNCNNNNNNSNLNLNNIFYPNKEVTHRTKNSEFKISSSDRSFSQSFILRNLLEQNRKLTSNKFHKKPLSGSVNEERFENSRNNSSQRKEANNKAFGSLKKRIFESNNNVCNFNAKSRKSSKNLSVQFNYLRRSSTKKNSKYSRFNFNNVGTLKVKKDSRNISKIILKNFKKIKLYFSFLVYLLIKTFSNNLVMINSSH
jgi:signal transduction histidine kinase